MFRSRVVRAALGGLLAVALAAGCSAGGEGDGKNGQGSTDVAAGGKDFGDARKATAALGTDAAPGRFPRTIKQAMGATTIKSRPKRVIVLDVGELDNVVALGIRPVGVAYSEGSQKMPAYLAKQAGKPESVGTINQLNLEKIASLRPDLILGSKLRAAQLYTKLAAIAPTVFSIRPGFTWKENFRLNAAALDRTKQANTEISAYEDRARKLGARLGKKRPTISMVRFLPDRIRLYANQSFIGTILDDAGLPRPASEDVDDLAVEVSPEQIGKADADYVFYGTYGPSDKTDAGPVTSGKLWKQLGAVKKGRSARVSDETWYLGLGVSAANAVLDDLGRLVTT
ncbi:MAG TPA: iron-siderophore ABC transporter substrate-binding protein [Streptosporangiaceae bacterium]